MEDVQFCAILTAIVKRFVRLVGVPAALNVARRVPGLIVDETGNVLAYDKTDPLPTLTILIDQYETVFGNIASTLAQQATQTLRSPPKPVVNRNGNTPTVTRPITILIADDHVVYREGLASLLYSQSDFKIVGQVDTIENTIQSARDLKPNVVLLDCDLADGDAASATRAILNESPQTSIVFLGTHDNQEWIFDAIRAGVVGFLFKTMRSTELVNTIRGVMRGEAGISRTIARRLLQELSRTPAPQDDEFCGNGSKHPTKREIEIIRELARGASNREIAQRFVISENTVRNHVGNVLAKLHLRSRRDVAQYVRRYGIPVSASARDAAK